MQHIKFAIHTLLNIFFRSTVNSILNFGRYNSISLYDRGAFASISHEKLVCKFESPSISFGNIIIITMSVFCKIFLLEFDISSSYI